VGVVRSYRVMTASFKNLCKPSDIPAGARRP
jgi:hypothetical protein